jgi:hypothetical protein
MTHTAAADPRACFAEPAALVAQHFEVLMAIVYPYSLTGKPEERQMAAQKLTGPVMAALLPGAWWQPSSCWPGLARKALSAFALGSSLVMCACSTQPAS